MVLNLWLGIVPEYTAIFIRLILIEYLFNAMSGPLWMSVQATGNIRNYQLIVSIFIFLNLPLSYLALKYNFPPYFVYIIRTVLSFFTLIWRIFYLRDITNVNPFEYIKSVILTCFFVLLLSSVPAYLTKKALPGWVGFFSSCFTSVIIMACFIYAIGLSKSERTKLKSIIASKILTGK